MAHGPSTNWGEDKALKIKSKIGLTLFWIYALIYAAFIVINVIDPKIMGLILFGGLNLAVIYGFGLIILAIIMGILYNNYCNKKEAELNKN